MKRFILVGALAALEVVGVGCGGKEGAAKKAAGAAGPAVSVVVAPVVQKTVPVYSEFTARTDANDTVEIRARVAAFLQSMHFQEGTAVKKGQPLFTLDKREFQASLQTAKAQLAKAEADLQSAREQSQVDTARANRDRGGSVKQGRSGCEAAEAAGRTAGGATAGLRQCAGPAAGRPSPVGGAEIGPEYRQGQPDRSISARHQLP